MSERPKTAERKKQKTMIAGKWSLGSVFKFKGFLSKGGLTEKKLLSGKAIKVPKTGYTLRYDKKHNVIRITDAKVPLSITNMWLDKAKNIRRIESYVPSKLAGKLKGKKSPGSHPPLPRITPHPPSLKFKPPRTGAFGHHLRLGRALLPRPLHPKSDSVPSNKFAVSVMKNLIRAGVLEKGALRTIGVEKAQPRKKTVVR